MMLTARQVADRLGVAHVTVRMWVNRGIIPAQKIGGNWFFDPADVAAFVLPKNGRPKKSGHSRT